MSVSIFPYTTWISSFTISSCFTVDNNLSIESNWSWVGIIEHNVESISKCRGSSLSPAWSTIDWDMLVLVPWEIVDTINVTPVPRGWEICLNDFIPSITHGWSGTVLKECLGNSASRTRHKFRFDFWNTSNSFLVYWVISFSLSSSVSNIISPCI